MKSESNIFINLVSKLAIWKADGNRSERLQEHIRMLDWVLIKEMPIRSIEQIVLDKRYELNYEDWKNRK